MSHPERDHSPSPGSSARRPPGDERAAPLASSCNAIGIPPCVVLHPHPRAGGTIRVGRQLGATGGTVLPDDGLERWIGDLRDRLKRGALAGIGPIDIGYGTGHLRGETVIRVMLADLDHLDALPAAAREWVDFPDR